MAKSAKKRSVGLKPMREYPTFQGLYELHPLNELTNDELYAKCILIIIEWLRGRIRKNEGDPSFLDKYPMPENYKSFDVSSLEDELPTGGYYMMSMNWQEENTWAIVVDEPGKREYQWFKTMITLNKKDNSVALAAQTICRETIEGKYEEVYRLGFISHVLMFDEDILITEYGIGTKWPLYPELIELNGKSKSEIESFKNDLIDNPHRNFPIIVQTPESEVRLYEDEAAKNKYFDSVKMVSYTVVMDGSAYKLFEESDKRCADLLNDDKGVVVINRANDNSAPKPYIIYDDEDDIKYSDFNGMCFDVQHSIRRKEVDFGEIGLYTDIRERRLLSNLSETGSVQSEELSLVIQTLQEELDEKTRTVANNAERIEELEAENEALKDKNLTLSRDNRKLEELELKLEDNKADFKAADEDKELLEQRIAKMRDEQEHFVKRAAPLFELPISDRRDVLKWIDENYGDRIIVHRKAEDSLLNYKKNFDIHLLCRMIHYLYGYTLACNEYEGDSDAIDEAAKPYDVLSDGFSACPSARKNTMKGNPDAFKMDISEYNPEQKELVLMDLHIKKGNNFDNSVRVNFYYDSTIKKSIIGLMPEHIDFGV